MYFYSHNIGDYDSHTSHLSSIEDLMYRRLICLYYRTEKPLTTEINKLCRLVRAKNRIECEAVEQVLSEFFSLQDDGWFSIRCSQEIQSYQNNANASRENGKKGGRPKKETHENPQETQQDNSGSEKETHENLKQETRNKKQETENKEEACPPAVDVPTSKPEKYKDECEDIFQHWKQVMGKSNQTLFSPERKRVIKARLTDGYSVDQLKDAITGCSKSEYHMGKNDSSTTYNELTLILRDATKVDKFLETTTKTSPQNTAGPNQPTYTPSSEIKTNYGPSEFAKQQHAEYMARKNGVQK